MRSLPVLAAILVAGCSSSAFSANDGPFETRGFPVSGPVHAIDLRGSDDVHVVPGALAVRATGPRAVLDHLDIHVIDGRLVVQRRGTVYASHGARITVAVPAIDAAALDGSGDMAVDRVAGPRFAAALSGSGDLTIGTLAVEQAAFQLRGSGDVKGSGHVRSLTVGVAGSGDVDLGALRADDATLAVHGSGDVSLGGAATVTGAASGSGDISVGGHPRCTIARSGSSEVRCG